MKKQVVTKLLNNKKMDRQVYLLRREVINLIYVIKRELQSIGYVLPRVEVRVAESSRQYLGVGRCGENMIWITEECIKHSTAMLLHVVAHELGHAVFNLDHNDKCPLMKPAVNDNPANLSQIIKILRKAV